MTQGRKNTTKKGQKSQTITKRKTRPGTSKSAIEKQLKAQMAKLQYEIIVMTVLVISFFIMLCVYFNIGGLFGEWIRTMLFGIFGFSAYLLPLFIFIGTGFKIFNHKNQRLNNKLILSFLLIVVISAVSHIKNISDSQLDKSLLGESTFYPVLINYFSLSAKNHFAGGFIGGFIGDIFVFVLDRNGAYIIFLLIGISLLILITEQSAFELLCQYLLF